jgi:hypothetical protein
MAEPFRLLPGDRLLLFYSFCDQPDWKTASVGLSKTTFVPGQGKFGVLNELFELFTEVCVLRTSVGRGQRIRKSLQGKDLSGVSYFWEERGKKAAKKRTGAWVERCGDESGEQYDAR